MVAIELIKLGATNDYCDKNGHTAFHLACGYGKVSDGDYPTKLKLIEKYRNVKDELNDLIDMEKLSSLKKWK